MAMGLCAMLAGLMMSRFGVETAKATPSVPTVTPSGDNPVNVIWRGNSHAALVTALMIEMGWVRGDQLPEHDAFAMLMQQDGIASRWYVWIYNGGWDMDWGYWSYASTGHYYFDPNPLHFGWYVDRWEDAEDKVYNDWALSSLPWSAVFGSYWLGNAGDYWSVHNDGSALLLQVYEKASGEGRTEWTQNSKFLLSGYEWDPILYDWEWTLPPFLAGTDTYEVFTYDDNSHVWWNQNGIVDLAAYDPNTLDSYGRSARITFGPFLEPYSDVPPSPLSVGVTTVLTLRGVVSKYGAKMGSAEFSSWTGMKFDAWFTDPANNGRRMVIEMYFEGTGLNVDWDPTGLNDNEHFRTLGDSIDDYMMKLQAFPADCTILGDELTLPWVPEKDFISYATAFLIDLKGIWQRAAEHFGRSSDDKLYAIALDVESGAVGGTGDHAFAQVNEIRVTYNVVVGGIVIPLDKFGLLAPYIGLASTILVAAAIHVRRVKRRKEKH